MEEIERYCKVKKGKEKAKYWINLMLPLRKVTGSTRSAMAKKKKENAEENASKSKQERK